MKKIMIVLASLVFTLASFALIVDGRTQIKTSQTTKITNKVYKY